MYTSKGRIFLLTFLLLSLLSHHGLSVAAMSVNITRPTPFLSAAPSESYGLMDERGGGSLGADWQAQSSDAAPTVSITYPPDGSVLTSTSVTVMGNASDDVGISKVEVSLDGTNWVIAPGTSSWSAMVALPEGQSIIQARAMDSSGNTALDSVSVTVELAEDDQPADILPGGLLTFIGIAVALMGLGLLAFVLLRQRSRGPPPSK